jgi:signal transduction histidine kinase
VAAPPTPALAHGLIAAWSHPIVGGDGRVLGTFGTYLRECREPSAAERRIVEILSHTAALAIERAMSDAVFRDIDRRKDEFLAVLSHELRNPLAPLRTGLQLLGVSAHDPVAVARLQGRMVRQVDQLIRLVDDLLESSRISRGELRLQMERVDAGTIIRTAIEAADALVQTAGLRLTMQIPATPVWVHGDIVRLAQIVTNLLNNAVKYSDAGGEVTVGARLLAANVEIFVRDTGVGIAPEHLERIFDMFTRGVDAGARAPQGLGIGLALARRLAELHGGRLTATSSGLGQGSEFTLILPAPVADS